MSNIKKKLNSPVDLIEERFGQFYQGHIELKKEFQKHYEKSLNYEAHDILCTNPSNWVISSWDSRSVQEMKDLAKILIQTQGKMVVFHSVSQQTWIFASSSSEDFNVSNCIKSLIASFGGNGGGSTVFGQWTGLLTMDDWINFQEQLAK